MPFLKPQTVLSLAGYSEKDLRAKDAISFAEELITGFTGLTFGASSTGVVLRFNLRSKLLWIDLPLDVTAVADISPAMASGESYLLNDHKLERMTADGPVAWDAKYYVLTVTKGIASVPPDINKAASLLVAHYLGLSDPDRSRYSSVGQGDFSGSYRFTELPVPEAQQMLSKYKQTVGADFV